MEKINYGLDEMHEIQLDMLKKLIAVCQEHNYSYFLAFGSLLGAARDHKIIPWDDSIDVVVPYADYEKLTNLPQDTWGGNLFMQTYYTDPQYPKCYAKLRNSCTTLIKADYTDLDINQGIYINIMPIINLSDDSGKRRRQMKDVKLYKALTERQPLPADDGTLRWYSSLLLGTVSDQRRQKTREELKQKVIGYAGKNTRECFVLAGNVSLSLVLASDWFSSAIEWEFEGVNVNIPKGWHDWLTLRYGDYMVAPISELQGDKISKFVTLNTQRPYTDYKGKTYCVQR